jgi:Flp pilus assembly protein TadD
MYPDDPVPAVNLGVEACCSGRYEECLAETREALRLDPTVAGSYTNQAGALISLDRLDEAKSILDDMHSRKLEFPEQELIFRYELAFLRGNAGELDKLVKESATASSTEVALLVLQSETETYFGRLRRAREYTTRAVQSALGANDQEGAAVAQASGALHEAELGNREEARKRAIAALTLSPLSKDTETLAALALARAGDSADAAKRLDKLRRRFASDTLLNHYWEPSIQAAIEISQKEPTKAVDTLEATAGYELGQVPPAATGTAYPLYLRGEALLLSQQSGPAAEQFQKILSHPAIVVNYPLRALATLGLARAYGLQKQIEKERSACQDFFALWHDADPELPLLRQTKAECAKLP